jgi:hypothetical protein
MVCFIDHVVRFVADSIAGHLIATKPTPVDFQVLLGALEDFLRRKVLGTDTAIRTIAESLPPRPPRPKKG